MKVLNKWAKALFRLFGVKISRYTQLSYFADTKALSLYQKYQPFTMIPKENFISNLKLIERTHLPQGAVVECGTWKGGMIAAIAEHLGGDRKYYLFDSFQGLPPAQPIDGDAANRWQQDRESAWYYDNCKADLATAEIAMKMASVPDYQIHPGWFESTLPKFSKAESIAVLRLDADWYESTLTCLKELYERVTEGGIIIVDDYYSWDGCAKALHDFLSQNGLSERVYQFDNLVAYLIKKQRSALPIAHHKSAASPPFKRTGS